MLKGSYVCGGLNFWTVPSGDKALNQPSYIKAFQSGMLKKRAEAAWEILSNCRLCPRACKVNRLHGETGFCHTGPEARVSSWGPHFGEEAPLVGRGGSGTLFFAYCNLGCLFCQNYELSHSGEGREAGPEFLAEKMVQLQQIGCHNLNWVTPTHVMPMLLKALLIAVPKGLSLPIVYNCGGYESKETLLLLDQIVDIYMPDFKFWDEKIAGEMTQAPDYPGRAREALKEMVRQVGDLAINAQGLAWKGILLRHLVMPRELAGTREIMEFIAREISPETYVNIMDQYRPCGEALRHPLINRGLLPEEYRQALAWAEKAGLKRLDHQSRREIMRWN